MTDKDMLVDTTVTDIVLLSCQLLRKGQQSIL